MRQIIAELANWLRRPKEAIGAQTRFVDLAPTEDADQEGVYSGALLYATRNPRVSNIALTGPYGSGKSSIIRSFLKRYRHPVLQISLAAFLPELHPHPEQKELTVAQAWEAERSALQPMLGPFDGFHETPHAVTGTCLISFDRNRYSVMAKAARRAVQVRAYADRIVVRLDDEVVAEHARSFGRDRMILDPWHYLPVLAKKPGALRNGAPFQNWELPPALARLRHSLQPRSCRRPA